MTDENDKPHGDLLSPLKLPERQIERHNPWADDLVGRELIAEQLTAIILNQTEPLRISLHGPWGTGKTFLLRRWAQQLRNYEYHAIYFSAWEEDFRRDPIIAILGQLYRELEPKQTFRNTLEQLSDITGKLLLAASNEALRAATGVDVSNIVEGIKPANPLEAYSEEGEVRNELQGRLLDLAKSVKDQTGQPLIFIIDELDRCRPTWAVECLERVKHLLEIQNIVFVFGVNRDELCKSIQHLNGDIDASTYLQRFFDLELRLSQVKLNEFLGAKLEELGILEYQRKYPESVFLNQLPELIEGMSLNFREIEHCARILALAVRKEELQYNVNTRLLGVLSILKVKTPELYRDLVEGRCRNIEVMNYIERQLQEKDVPPPLNDELAEIEIRLAKSNEENDPTARGQVHKLAQGQEPDRPEVLSDRLKRTGKERISGSWDPMYRRETSGIDLQIEMLNTLIDLPSSLQ